MDCEVCGRRPAEYIVLLEGARLGACHGCGRDAKKLYIIREEKGKLEKTIEPLAARDAEEELIDGYGRIIRQAREKANLSRRQLGMKIGEKENYLEAIEQERVKPTLATVKKLEKQLSIRLMEKEPAATVAAEYGNHQGKEITLGDFVAQKKK